MKQTGQMPRWLKPLNRLVVVGQRRGVVIGTMRLLSVPGRISGAMQTTPVSPFVVEGRRYVVAGLADADWVKNARKAGRGIVGCGRNTERVTLIELPVEERAAVLRAFPKQVPYGVGFFRRLYDLPGESDQLPDAFAALAPYCPVFRLDPLPPDPSIEGMAAPMRRSVRAP